MANNNNRTNLLDDLVILTTIPKSSFDKLVDKVQLVICHAVEESIENDESITEVNIGIGTLHIKVEKDAIKYRFSPSQSLNNNIKNTAINRKSPLVDRVETLLRDRICNVRKKLL